MLIFLILIRIYMHILESTQFFIIAIINFKFINKYILIIRQQHQQNFRSLLIPLGIFLRIQ